MNPIHTTTADKTTLLSKVGGNTLFSQGAVVRVLFQLMLLTSLILTTITANAVPDITNTATASYQINGNNLDVSDSVSFTPDTIIAPTDFIELEKSSDVTSALIGDNVNYTLTITNPNPRDLTNVSIQDTLPTGLVYQINSAQLNNTAINSGNIAVVANTLNIDIGTVPANTTWNVTYQANISATTPVGNALNIALVNSDTVTSAPAQSNVVVSQPIIVAPLILTKNVNVTDVKIGDTAKYTLTVENSNDFIIAGAVINDVVPQGLAFITGSATLNGTAITPNVNTNISFNLGNIPANSTSTLVYDVTVNSVTNNSRILVNSASVTATDPQANSNTATATINLVDDTLSIVKTTTATNVFAGDIIDYSIALTNPLTRALTNLTIKDTLPTGFVYQIGSAQVNSVSLANSDVSVSGNVVDFNIASVAPTSSIVLTYKVEVTENALPGDNTNTAQAISDFASSLTTTAEVRVRTPSTINFLKINNAGVSSIIQPTSFNTNQPGGNNFQAITNVALADGSSITLPTPQPIIPAPQFVVNDAVVIELIDLDQNEDSTVLETVEVTVTIPGTNDTEVLLLTETTPSSGVFRGVVPTTTASTQTRNGILTVEEGVSLNVSYFDDEDNSDTSATAALIIPATALQVKKTADKDFSAIGELVRYSIQFRNTTGSVLTDVQLNDLLPLGFLYIPNTATLNGNSLNSVSFNGKNITFNLNDMPVDSVWEVEYLTRITAGVQIGDAINRAYLTSGSVRSNTAQAIVKIRDDLMRSKSLLTGRVYIGCKTNSHGDEASPKVLGEARIYMETGRSVLSDEEGFWHMEGINPGAHVLQLDTESIPGYEPMLCNDNTRRAGNARSQFVDLHAGNLWHVDFHVKPIEGYKATEKSSIKENEAVNPSDIYTEEYLKNANGEFEILWPKNNYVPAVASTKIFIKHSPKQLLEVFLNGSRVSALNYDGSNTNKAKTATLKSWVGVDIDIKKKNNTLLAILKDKSGKEISRQTRNIHFSSNPASATLLEDQSTLIADGKTTPVISLLIKDEDGFPMRANTNGYYTIENNQYTVKIENTDDSNVSELNKDLSGSYKYDIGENGIARIQLNPTTQSGNVKFNLQFTDSNNKRSQSEISVWLKPKLREWILVGLAEGTATQELIDGNLRHLVPRDKEPDFGTRGRVAFFAKGKIQGKYLLTVAYDTHKTDREIGSQLNGVLDPDVFYTIYADNSNSQFEAPSSEKLYLKLEKDNFFALFGDYQTDLSVTELANYQRTLNGINTEYRGKRVNFKGFVSETSNNHIHEEIPGDGTSGLYQLQSRIIPNSEIIVIETRNRFRSSEILLKRELVRFQDYDIDYDSGTLFFKFPITSRDSEFNPNIIVIDYDAEDKDANKSISAGGRVALKSNNGKLETGLSYIHEGNNNIQDNQLIAVDATYQITPDTEVRVEVAQSKTAESAFQRRNAAIIELEKDIANLETLVYYRKLESNFGIDTQASEDGTEKAGVVVNYNLNKSTQINAEISAEKNLANDNERRLAQLNIVKQFKQHEIRAGFRHSQEDIDGDANTNTQIDSNTLLLGGRYTTKNDKVTLRADIEKNVSSKNGSEVSPDRVIVGADVKIGKGFSVFAEHEVTDNGDTRTNNSRVGLARNLWKGAKARTTFTQERTDGAQRDYATLGLSQTVKITDKIRADFTIDRAETLNDTQPQQVFNQDEPSRQGSISDGFTAFSVGLGSNDKDWSWTSRAEYRNGEITDKVNFFASILRHYDNGKNLSASFSHNDSNNENGNTDRSTRLSFGAAWHPKERDYVVLSRLDLESSRTTSVVDDSFDNNSAFANPSNTNTQKIVHNINYNRKINEKTQLAIHHGIKFVEDENEGVSVRSVIDTATMKLRRDINKKWDVGVHGGYLRDWSTDSTEYVAGVSVGHSPKKDIWVELGYNLEGFKDSDFDNNSFTSQGVYADFRYKFDQETFKGDLPFRRKAKTKEVVKESK